MNAIEFEETIDRLGEDMSQWPAAQRQAADELLASSPEAQAILDEARALRAALTTPTVRAPPGLADRIVAAASKLARAPPCTDDASSATGPTERAHRLTDESA